MSAAAAEVKTPWYQRRYFIERVDEEIYHARRYDLPGSLAIVRSASVSRQGARALHEFVESKLRRLDFGGLLGNGDYAICLPHTPRAGAEILVGRLKEHLAEFSPTVVCVAFPEDGVTFDELNGAAAKAWPAGTEADEPRRLTALLRATTSRRRPKQA